MESYPKINRWDHKRWLWELSREVTSFLLLLSSKPEILDLMMQILLRCDARNRDGAVVRAFASHQCGPVSILSQWHMIWVFRWFLLCSMAFCPGSPVFLPPQKPASPNFGSTRIKDPHENQNFFLTFNEWSHSTGLVESTFSCQCCIGHFLISQLLCGQELHASPETEHIPILSYPYISIYGISLSIYGYLGQHEALTVVVTSCALLISFPDLSLSSTTRALKTK